MARACCDCLVGLQSAILCLFIGNSDCTASITFWIGDVTNCHLVGHFTVAGIPFGLINGEGSDCEYE